MKKIALLTASIAMAMLAGQTQAQDVKLGVIFGFTGPIESLTPSMAAAAELAIAEINESGAFMGGTRITPIRGDSTCIDAQLASSTAERLVTSDKISAIVGADCSGVTKAILDNVAKPNGIVMISPSATSPGLSSPDDDGFFFRTAPSDARQGEVIADILREQGYRTAAITYTNNDYGKGLSDSIARNFEIRGGVVTTVVSHEDGKGDYTAEAGALAQAGGDILVVAGYTDQGGRGVIQAALDNGGFDVFFLPDGMIGEELPKAIGRGLDGSIGTLPGTDSEGAENFAEMAKEAGIESSIFTGESYDAAALIVLAMQKAGSTDSRRFKDHVEEVANEPGIKIYPGELGRALDLIRAGRDIDYVGATAVELVNNGESAGSYAEIEVQDGEIVTVNYR